MPRGLVLGIPITAVSSAARTTSSNSGNLKGTTANVPVAAALSWFLDVTALSGDDANVSGLQVYLDTSPDSGTTWLNFGKFARITSSTGTRVINMRPTGIGPSEAAAEAAVFSTTTSVTVAINAVLSPDIRVRWVLGNGTGQTSAPSSTFAVYVFAEPMSLNN